MYSCAVVDVQRTVCGTILNYNVLKKGMEKKSTEKASNRKMVVVIIADVVLSNLTSGSSRLNTLFPPTRNAKTLKYDNNHKNISCWTLITVVVNSLK